MHVLGRRGKAGPTGHLGRYRAWDGSPGQRIGVDLNRPHAVAVVGKRGSGKSYTLGVLAEELLSTSGVVPVVLDPMAAIGGPEGFEPTPPTVHASAIPAQAWPDLLGLDPEGPAGALIWRAAAESGTFTELESAVATSTAAESSRRTATNHLRLAASWDVFDPGGVTPNDLLAGPAWIDLSGLASAPMNAVARAVADGLYHASQRRSHPLPWLLVDEAHTLFEGVARPALTRLLRRGRQLGISLVLATQRPTALPDVALSQADLLIAHRLTGDRDLTRLRAARPSVLQEDLSTRYPDKPGEALVIDDTTEQAHPITVRTRTESHPGDSPRVQNRESGGGSPSPPAASETSRASATSGDRD